MAKFNFVEGIFGDKEGGYAEDLQESFNNLEDELIADAFYEEDFEATGEFIEEVCNAVAPEGSGKSISILDSGGLMLFMVFEGEDDDGVMVDAFAALNLLGQEWIMMPAFVSEWIVEQLLRKMDELEEGGF